jgi:DNA (cytosine-5)-methyltransferase 1
MKWRSDLVARVLADDRLFSSEPIAQIRKKARNDAALEETRALLDEGITYLREISRLAALLHGTDTTSHKPEPVDELVWVILSRKSRDASSDEAFQALKTTFRSWNEVLSTPEEDVRANLGSFAERAGSLIAALQALHDSFGSCTLDPVRAWPNDQLLAFLSRLPGLDAKGALRVMLFSLDRKVFPADADAMRVLTRLGPYRELGLELSELSPREVEALLGELIPPNLRQPLHLTLAAHGREVCRSQKPLCNACDLRNFCKEFRRKESARIESLELPRLVDLFTGAGGLSEGFERAGFQVKLALDLDASALRTYWLNHPGVPDDRILCKDIREIVKGEFRQRVGRQPIDVLIGAPPCQGFSHVGHRSKSTKTGYNVTSDARNFLYTHMVEAALELKPKLFLMENVPGMKSAKKGDDSFLDAAAHALQAAGYQTDTWKLNAAAFGVPQERLRVFLVAARGGPPPQRPEAQYQDIIASAFDHDALPPVTFEDAVFDLPRRGPDEGTGVDLWPTRTDSSDPRYRRYLAKFRLLSSSRFIFNHTVRYHNERDLKLYALLQPGEDSVHAIERYGATDLMRYRSDVFDDKYAKLRNDRPCKTIVSHLAKDGNGYIHPTQSRSISFREAARVQSFRDDYVFTGSPSDQWVQLGNAVPPVMAEAIGRSFLTALQTRGTR